MAQGTFTIFNMFSNYVRGNIVNLNSGAWRVILCSDSVADLTAAEENPARGSTNINEVTAGGGYSTGGIALTLANTSASSVFTFTADTAVHTDGILSWSKGAGSPIDIKSAVLMDDNATSPVDAAIGFWDMTEDGGTTALSLVAVDINLVLDSNTGRMFTWGTNN
jgi:hypothetical protein